MAAALVTQIAYAVQTLFDPAGTAGRLVDLGKLANYGLLTNFTPAALFTTGVNGAWYDPSDFSTLFQDAAGTTPVTAVEQPVGLMLDKSKGLVLGSENVVSPYTGFVDGSWVISGTSVTRNGTATQPCSVSFGGPLIASKQYRVSFTVSDLSGDTFTVAIGGVNAGNITTNGQKSFILTGGGVSIGFIPWNGTVGQVTITNISVRELPGNHAYNPSGNSANFPVLSARYNLLTKTEDFSDAVWVKGSAVSTSGNRITYAGSGTLTTGRIDQINFVSGGTAGKSFTVCAKLKSASGANQVVRLKNTHGGVVDNFSADITVTSEWQYFFFSVVNAASAGDGAQIVGIVPGVSGGAFDILGGFDLRVSNDALNQPAYQRVNTPTDYDTVGFKPYLSFNGVNQWLQTNSIDFTYGDKMFVCAGVRKLSDAVNNGAMFELSAAYFANNGSFLLQGPVSGATYGYSIKGSIQVDIVTELAYPSPITNVLSGISNISAPSATLRANGSQVAQSTATQGTGNYGNYPLYIGARAGTLLWFNGRLYGLVVAGKQASASEIASTEAYLNQKTGAY